MKNRDPIAAKTKLMSFLYGCTLPALATVSACELASRYGTDVRTAEYELVIARQKRGG